jgi:hypothetical protein
MKEFEMSVHTVEERTTVRSSVEVIAPPGASTESVVKIAMKEVTEICKSVGFESTSPAELTIDPPMYVIGHNWRVNIVATFQATAFHEFWRV